ncbi:MAG: CBS domain-containing protein [Candidatus Aenigmarchaeota archaeon]|nr:CBS domain-containing protein [Candidatus Aenigmarchaeota archaeon]
MPRIDKFIEHVAPVRPEAELHEFLETLRTHQAVPVVDGDVKGIVFVDDVSRREYPINAKAKSIMTHVPTVAAGADATDAATALISGRHKALPVLEKGAYKGLITDRGVLRAIAEKPLGRRVKDVMNEPITMTTADDVGKARSMMRDHGIGKLPVVDGDNVIGIVDWTSFVSLERPKESLGRRDRKGDYLQDFKLSVTTVMNRAPLTMRGDVDVAEAAKKMGDASCSYAIVTEGRKLVGIITCEDILEVMAARAPKEGVYVQITGADELDAFESEKLHSNVDETVKKLARIYSGIEYFFLHLKKYESEGERHKYSVRTRLMTPVGTFISHAHGFDLARVVDEAMDHIERIVKEDHSKRQHVKRGRTERTRKER